MRIIFAIFALVEILLGALCVFGGITTPSDRAVVPLGAILLLSGVVFIVASKTKYGGHWAFVVGIGLVNFAFAGAYFEYQDWRKDSSYNLTTGITLVASLLTFGALTLSSAHKLHRSLLRVAEGSHPSQNPPSLPSDSISKSSVLAPEMVQIPLGL